MKQRQFGDRTWNVDLLLAGTRSREEFVKDLADLVIFLNMDAAGMAPDVRSYPLPDGRGGEGLTIMQPYVEPQAIYHQPLTTSFAIIDSWPEHFTLTIKSCLQFSAEAVMQFIFFKYGPNSILDCHAWTLGPVTRQRPGRAFCGGGGDGCR